jgi:protein SCO1/2
MAGETARPQGFSARGVVQSVNRDAGRIVIRHEAISNYMAAMTMPFKVKAAGELAGVAAGDIISFQLHVTETESWVDQIVKTGTAPPAENKPAAGPKMVVTPAVHAARPLLDYKFTNELGQAVSLNDFRGQALAITFFYTRCPLPDYCPRLSKNFQAASEQLAAMSGGPTNWHFLSISFDPEFDSPPMLKAYAESYQYDPARWSFLTGPADKIAELARVAGVTYQAEGNIINHDFRTLIIDARGQLQMVFPTSGDLSDQIVAEMLKAAAGPP